MGNDMNFERLLNKILNEMFPDDEYREQLRLSQAPTLIWSYYLGGHKKKKMGDLPHLVPYKKGDPYSMLSDGTRLKVGDQASIAYKPDVQKQLIEWLTSALGRDVRDMKVFQVMRLVRQYTETPQPKIEKRMKDPFNLTREEEPEPEQEEEDTGEFGLGGNWWEKA
jgi:hypothetical protein